MTHSQPTDPSTRHAGGIMLLIAFAVVVISVYQQARNFAPGTFPFSIDYYAFWSSYQLFDRGENPYNHELLLAQEAAYSSHTTGPIYYPPSMLVILSPLLSLPFSLSVTLFAALNISLLIIAGWCASSLSGYRPLSGVALLSALFVFVPAMNVLQFGQLSLLVTASFYLSLLLWERGSPWAAGALLVPVGIKPHLVYLAALAFAVCLIRRRNWVPLAVAGVLTALALLSAELQRPGIVGMWIERTSETNIHAAVSLVTPLRFMLQDSIPVLISYLPLLLPSLTAAAVLVHQIWYAPVHEGAVRQWLPWLLWGSVLTSPYLWIFDHAALLYIHIDTWSRVQHPLTSPFTKRVILSLSVLYQGFILLLECLDILDHRLWWFPLPLMALWYLSRAEVRLEGSR